MVIYRIGHRVQGSSVFKLNGAVGDINAWSVVTIHSCNPYYPRGDQEVIP